MTPTIGELLEDWWKNTESVSNAVAFLAVYLATCYVLYQVCTRRRPPPPAPAPEDDDKDPPKRILLLTAHPDDECMFFGPTILELLRQRHRVYLVCFSRGGYDSDEKVRQAELWEACQVLGISRGDITIYSDTLLPDDPRARWPAWRLGEIILRHVESLRIHSIITFDREGVSGHPNHVSLFYALAHLSVAGKLPRDVKLYTLDSVNVLRKYWSYLDLPFGFLLSSRRAVLSWKESRVVVAAMRRHASQWVWFRKLYVLFSRFIVINTLKEVTAVDLELELQLED